MSSLVTEVSLVHVRMIGRGPVFCQEVCWCSVLCWSFSVHHHYHSPSSPVIQSAGCVFQAWKESDDEISGVVHELNWIEYRTDWTTLAIRLCFFLVILSIKSAGFSVYSVLSVKGAYLGYSTHGPSVESWTRLQLQNQRDFYWQESSKMRSALIFNEHDVLLSKVWH